MINNYTKRQLEWEQKDLEPEGFNDEPIGKTMLHHLELVGIAISAIQQKGTSEFICRVGGNSGWNFTTGAWMKKTFLSVKEIDLLRKTIQRRDYGDMNLWPKTRKMTLSGIPLGFVKIKF